MIVGLTGSFGTGKSFVASIFKWLGASIIDADTIARKELRKSSPSYRRIVAAFGEGILGRRRNIDRRKLAALAFGESRKLKILNRIVHPAVIEEIKARVSMAGREAIIVIDAPLLVEANLVGMVDELIVVKAPRRKQIERCTKKFGITKEGVLKRIRGQIPIERKMRMADFVIDNGGTRSQTKRQVEKIWVEISRNIV